MNEGAISTKGEMEESIFNDRKRIFAEDSYLPIIPVKCIDSIVLEARWKEEK